MNDQQIEKEIVAKGKTAPRITSQHIENIIMSESYFTAHDGWVGANIHKNTGEAIELDDLNQLKLLTFCVLVLANGFTVTVKAHAPALKTSTKKSGARLLGRMP